ncbi:MULTISPECIES: GGDEF domain-containing protein [Leeia]|uniref:diguanylate cyclase n=1 Tax=Leeia aquatica TaxID=2725557 RepID=A0A847SB46_9NEIS|nr:GGDEF domain-containing protein [Leeia aquatica]NLR76125.1 GGDEF domain-containing protein [Leeia aquatica]
MAASPADIARIALIRLAEQSLPPTPENYARFYYDVTGTAQPAMQDAQLVAQVQQVVQDANLTTLQLVQYLGGQNATLETSIEDLSQADDKTRVLHLLNSLISTTRSMQQTVEASRTELNETRQTLQQLQHEVEMSHHDMEHDLITGVQNRLGMDKTLAKEVSKAQSTRTKLTVSLIAIDSFEEHKKRHGIDSSDKLLQHLVTVGRSVMRDSDSMVRYGQEEFLLVLPETDLKGARFVLDRLQLILHRSPVFVQNDKIQVSLSAGIAQMQGNEKSHSLVMRADRALFAAKAVGNGHIEYAGQQ